MTQSIEFPIEITYWIVYDTIPDDLVAYGTTTPEQVTTTCRANLWYTIDKIEWQNKLLNDFGVIYPPPEPETIPEPTPGI